MARNQREMTAAIRSVLSDQGLADELSAHGRQTILSRHTCAHRVDQLLGIHTELHGGSPETAPAHIIKERIS